MKSPLQAAADIVDNALMYRIDGNGNCAVPVRELEAVKRILAAELMTVELPEWARDRQRLPWVRNSLRHRATELRKAATRCRTAYQQPYMQAPAEWLADAYTRASNVLATALQRLGEEI